MAYSQTNSALLMKGTYNVITIFRNAVKRDGTPCKPYWNVMLADGGKMYCPSYQALAALIGPAEDRRDYNPPVMVEFYVEPTPTGAKIVPKPAMPPASTILPPPPTPGPTIDQAAGGAVVYGPSPTPVGPSQVYPGTAAPPRQAQPVPVAQPPIQQPPVQQPDVTPVQKLPGEPAMTRGEEVKRREAMELMKSQQIARMNALTQLASLLNASALSFQERWDRLDATQTLEKCNILVHYILSGETSLPEGPEDDEAPI